MEIELLSLNKNHLQLIPKWTKEWMNADTFALTIFSCPGYSSYLTLQYSLPINKNAIRLVGAYDGNKLIGFVEYRFMENTIFINNLCINEEMRGLGIGRRFLNYAIALAGEYNLPSVSLNCFHWNTKALEMYLNWGFQLKSNSFWYIGENPYGDLIENIDFLMEDYSNAEVCQQAFGFSNFQIRTNKVKHSIGRIHNDYFRIIERNDYLDHHLLKIVAQMDRTRSIFVISPEAELKAASFLRQVSTSARMELVL